MNVLKLSELQPSSNKKKTLIDSTDLISNSAEQNPTSALGRSDNPQALDEPEPDIPERFDNRDGEGPNEQQRRRRHRDFFFNPSQIFSSLLSINQNFYLRFCLSFFLFGLLNNVLYVIILSSALDLVPSNIPTGVILLANIAPSLIVKLVWPYYSRGQIRYNKRLITCPSLSFFGMIVIVIFDSVPIRLFGIGLGSLSSGLGEMTFLQLSSKYIEDDENQKDRNRTFTAGGDGSGGGKEEKSLPSISISWFSSGTGAAGVFGAGFWWLLKSLGVRTGLGISSILPICLSLAYFIILPGPEKLITSSRSLNQTENHYRALMNRNGSEEEETRSLADNQIQSTSTLTVTENPRNNSNRNEIGKPFNRSRASKMVTYDKRRGLSLTDKVRLAKTLLVPFMLPLFFVYFAEYTINTGIAPVLIYPLPRPEDHPLFSRVFKSLRDYYPFWQLTYQTFVFFARSSIAIFKFRPLPKFLIPFPSMIQIFILLTLYLESSRQVISVKVLGKMKSFGLIYSIVFGFICLEGICGGLAYVSVYYWLSKIDEDDIGERGVEDGYRRILNKRRSSPVNSSDVDQDLDPNEVDEQEEEEEVEESFGDRSNCKDYEVSCQEFRIACVGFSDTFGILLASLFSSWLQPKLCRDQIENKIYLCKEI